MMATRMGKLEPKTAVQVLVLGSCHLNNVVAREKRGLARELLQELCAAARAQFRV